MRWKILAFASLLANVLFAYQVSHTPVQQLQSEPTEQLLEQLESYQARVFNEDLAHLKALPPPRYSGLPTDSVQGL
jgi:hypothetical protein